MASTAQKYLVAYSGVLTLAFAAVVLTGATSLRSDKFDTIDVQRINVREPDGTLRMVVSNKAGFPGAIFGDREYKHPRGVAGMIFYNDEGMENGGLVFNGKQGADGKSDSEGHLSFDPYDRDQAVALSQAESDGEVVRAGLQVNDTSSRSVEGLLREMERIDSLPESEREAARKALFAADKAQGGGLKPRVFVGKRRQRSVVALGDANGKPRLVLQVTPEGQAKIEFLDADGKVQRTLAPGDLDKQ
jgi:hypothetical protein